VNIAHLTLEQLELLERDLNADGVAVIRDVELPGTFDPPCTDLVWIGVDRAVEVYISAATRYNGKCATTRALLASEPMPGDSRYIGRCRYGAWPAARLFIGFVELSSDGGAGHTVACEPNSTVGAPLSVVGLTPRIPTLLSDISPARVREFLGAYKHLLSRFFHPDRGGNGTAEVMKELNAAFDCLAEQYDQ
jgi:hypothetical protein